MTRRTLFASLLLIVVVAGVIGALLVAIGRQHRTAGLARHSESVIAAANLVEQRFLAVQTNVRGYLIRGNADVLSDYRAARGPLPDSVYELRSLVDDNPSQARLADDIREQALSYVNDYADPVIARTRSDGIGPGRGLASSLDGRAKANELTERVHDFVSAEQVLSASRTRNADDAAARAKLLALLGLGLCVVALLAVTLYVNRRIVRPIERLALAADRVRRGEAGATVDVRGHDELARLGSAFNEMAHALEQSHEELESQNTELEMQAIALEERQEELSEAADEARAQRDELSLIAAQLAEEKRRAELYGSFGDRLAAERDLEALARVALQALVTAAGADVGVLYTESWRDAARWARVAVVGLEPAPLAEYAVAGGEGAGARAVATRDVVHVRSGSTGLRVRTLAGEALVLWELHVPLTIGERAVGIATLGGVSSEAFDEGESLLLTRLAGQAAVALAEGSALAQRGWLSQVNAAVLDGVREGIALVGLDHELVFANAAMEQLAERLSMPIGAAIGARGADLSTAAVDFDAYFAEWETILADGDEPTADELTVAGVVLERFTAPVDDDAGLRIGRLVVLRDVTREREAEQLKSTLMATVSHELRTPLASVLGYAELLRTRPLESSQREEIVGTVHREAKRLSALIDDFLDLQTIEQDRLELVRAAFDVDELLHEAITTFRGQSTAHELVFTGSSGDAGLVAFADRARIVQVVANLLSNAIKYSPAGGVVRVSATGGPGFVRIAVADQGLGIPAAEQSRVFEKFFRVARPDHTVGGTGLGLALAHDIVEAHDGTMGFESTEGVGSTFWFTLPKAT